jgi:hypothetical protein
MTIMRIDKQMIEEESNRVSGHSNSTHFLRKKMQLKKYDAAQIKRNKQKK